MPLEATLPADDKIGNVGEDFGAIGPWAYVVLMCGAKLRSDGGRVKYTWRGWKRAIYSHDIEEARQVLAQLGEQELVLNVEADETGFEAQVAAWRDWNKGHAALRQQRARSVTERDEALRSVTERDEITPIEERRGKENRKQSSVASQPQPASSARATTRKKPDPDAIPDGYPAALLAFVGPIKDVLTRIANLRPGALPPTTAAVAAALRAHSDRDFLPIAEDYEHWLTHGGGQGKAPKDPVQGFRNQLRRSTPVAVKTTAGRQGVADRAGKSERWVGEHLPELEPGTTPFFRAASIHGMLVAARAAVSPELVRERLGERAA